MRKFLFSFLTLIPFIGFGQNYTSYFTGSTKDTVTNASGGVCLMGGATENDNAMRWFLQRANGGDVLVLRTTGGNGYNSYLFSSLGISVNSVETIVCNNALASTDQYVLQKISQAEAIWFAGGDQWSYINYWKNTSINTSINQAIKKRNIVIGGTSAGMAIQGKYYFSAQNGTVTSSAALANPFNNLVTVDSSLFIKNTFLNNTITDTHFDNPDRKGRLVTFLARILTDYAIYAKAIACDEYTAVCIDTNGMARVFGGYPTYDDNAYFIQSNCGLTTQIPENCSASNPLTWNLGGEAIKAYQIKGDDLGSNTFNLKNWQTGSGGVWYNWSVANGIFSQQSGTELNCIPLSVNNLLTNPAIEVYPNPTTDNLSIKMTSVANSEFKIIIYNNLGQEIYLATTLNNSFDVDLSNLNKGLYCLLIYEKNKKVYKNKIIKN